jgi:Ca2+-binding RTX toxin-like protein
MTSTQLRSALLASTLACALSSPALLAATDANFTSGTLTVSSDAGDALVLTCAAGDVHLNGSALVPAVACSDVERVEAAGGPGANLIDLSGMQQADFTSLRASLLAGGPGSDTVIGAFSDDSLVWNPGDGSDGNDGGDGHDRIVVNGSEGNNTFLVGTAGTAPGFELRFVGPFTIDIARSEALEINGLGGDDTLDASALPAGLIALEFFGGAGADTQIGSAGDDLFIWNPGDGSDTVDGRGGVDTVEVRGSDSSNTFTVGTSPASGFDVRFVGPFTIDIVNGERLEIHGNGGDDNINASALPPGLIALEIIAGSGADAVIGSAGGDRIIWNPGDGSDTNDGGGGTDRIVVNGSDGANTFTVGTAGAAAGFDLRFVGPFAIDIVRAEVLEINGRGGDDSINASALPAGLIALEITGGTGNDTIVGSAGNDTNIWNNGDNTDTFDGGPGDDLQIVNGAPAGDLFTVQAAAGGAIANSVLFRRGNLVPFDVTLGNTERLQVNGLAGDDSIDASALPAGLIALELVGGPGADTVVGSAGDDRIIWNPGDGSDTNDGGAGNDRVVVNGSDGSNSFSMGNTAVAAGFDLRFVGPFTIDIRDAETLEVNGRGGDDSIDASALAAGLVALELDGGEGNDTLTGSAGDDILRGGPGNDTLTAGLGTDQVFGDAGDDVLVWNPGDGSDFNDGGEGNDTSRVLAAGAAETFSIAPLGCNAGAPCARLRRILPSVFDVDVVRVERLELLAGGGRDTVSTEFLPGVLQVLDGGSPTLGAAGVDFFPVDELRVAGVSDASASPVVRPGFGHIEHSGFEFAPTMALAALGGETGHTASPSGDQEVPPVNSSAEARGSVVLSGDGSRITVRLEFSGLGSANTLSHIHGPAAVGSNGPVIFDLGSSGGTAGVLGPLEFAINAEQRAQLLDGLWYFNVHSSNHPTGEIRGQILMDQVFEAQLSPQQVVGDAVVSQASGHGTLILSGTRDSVVLSLDYTGLTGEGVPGVSTAVVLRGPAPRGNNGPVLADFPLRLSATASDSFLTQEYPITADEAEQLRAGQWYIEVSSQEFPNGELRGQLDNILFCSGFEDSGC